MMDIAEIGRSIAALHGPTEAMLSEWDEKATAAIVLNKTTAVELSPGDIRAVTSTVRAMLSVHDTLYRSLKLHAETEAIQGAHIEFLRGAASQDQDLIKRSLELVTQIQTMDFWQLVKFWRLGRRGSGLTE